MPNSTTKTPKRRRKDARVKGSTWNEAQLERLRARDGESFAELAAEVSKLGAPRTRRAVQQMLFRMNSDGPKRVYVRGDPLDIEPFDVLGDAEFVRRLLAAAQDEGLLPRVAA